MRRSKYFLFSDSISFNQHHVIEPKIVHARHKRTVENTREEVRKIFTFIFSEFYYRARRLFTFFLLISIKPVQLNAK